MATLLSDPFAPGPAEAAPFPLEAHSAQGHPWIRVQGTGRARQIEGGAVASAPGTGLAVYALGGFEPSGAHEVSLGVRAGAGAPIDCAGPAAGIAPDGKSAIVGYRDLATGYPTIAVVQGGATVAFARCPRPWAPSPADRLSIALDPARGTATLALGGDPAQAATLDTPLAAAGGRVGLYFLRVGDGDPVRLSDLRVATATSATPADPADPPEPVGPPAPGALRRTVYQVVAHGEDAAAREALALAAPYSSLAKWREDWSVMTTVPRGASLVDPASLAAQLAARPATATSLDWQTGYVRETDGGVPSIGDPAQDARLLFVTEGLYVPTPTAALASSIVAGIYGVGRALTFAESAQLLSARTQGFADVGGIVLAPLPVEYMVAVGQTVARRVTVAAPAFLAAPPYDAALTA